MQTREGDRPAIDSSRNRFRGTVCHLALADDMAGAAHRGGGMVIEVDSRDQGRTGRSRDELHRRHALSVFDERIREAE